jgi:cell division protein FtsB
LTTSRKQETDSKQAAERRFKRGFRTYVFILACLFVAGSVSALVGKDGLLDKRRLRAEIRMLEQEVELQRQDAEALERDIRDLEAEPMARERIAREQLGLALPGEYLFILPEEGSLSDQAESGAE